MWICPGLQPGVTALVCIFLTPVTLRPACGRNVRLNDRSDWRKQPRWAGQGCAGARSRSQGHSRAVPGRCVDCDSSLSSCSEGETSSSRRVMDLADLGALVLLQVLSFQKAVDIRLVEETLGHPPHPAEMAQMPRGAAARWQFHGEVAQRRAPRPGPPRLCGERAQRQEH